MSRLKRRTSSRPVIDFYASGLMHRMRQVPVPQVDEVL